MAVDRIDSASSSLELERACTQFLFREAELLDGRQYSEWLETCLCKDLEYLVPIRVTREQAEGLSDFSQNGFHIKDTYASMELRVERLLTEHAWAEDPPSRTERLVTNVRVREQSAEEAQVRSNLMLYRSQGDTINYDLIVGERQDILRLEDGEWRLRRRLVLLKPTILGTANLGVFL